MPGGVERRAHRLQAFDQRRKHPLEAASVEALTRRLRGCLRGAQVERAGAAEALGQPLHRRLDPVEREALGAVGRGLRQRQAQPRLPLPGRPLHLQRALGPVERARATLPSSAQLMPSSGSGADMSSVKVPPAASPPPTAAS